MKETRSASQILFGFLPGQTVDLKSRVWKVKEWVEPRPRSIERQALRQELERQLVPWAISDRDGKYLDHLRRGYSVRLYSLNHETGVTVEKFPQNWVCQTCDRLNYCRKLGHRNWLSGPISRGRGSHLKSQRARPAANLI